MRINKYPIEVEFTDFCGLKCKSCINYLIKNKSEITKEKFNNVLNYIFNNINNILYINFSGIGDIFLHPKIDSFLKLFIKKFKDTKINLLIPTKGQSINQEQIDILKRIGSSGINLNISVGIYSLLESKYNKLSGSNTFNKTIRFIKDLKYNNINFSLELLDNKLSQKEKIVFNNFIKKLGIGGSIHNYHNFSGVIDNNSYTYGNEECSFNGEDYKIEGILCGFIPFISKNGNIYSCSISGKNKQFLIGNIKELFIKYPNYLDLVSHVGKILNKNICKECSIYKFSN